MNSAIIVMTILGCSDAADSCEFIRTANARYSTQAQCEAQVATELQRTGSAGYPTVAAICEPQRQLVERKKAKDVNAAVAIGPMPAAETDLQKQFTDLRDRFRRNLRSGGEAIVSVTQKIGNGIRKVFVRDGNSDPVVLSRFGQ